ncbi:ethanolamine utilization protein EutJ [Dasania marina]|uniref:ethanolamine utilization protein EutJ n=1 Tax=Dasania marina TaxID=471499 RepID=UPI0030D9B737|tara:strand:+ start:22698 stop:23564 length:867 start_codon:yes stop_codon:yes gene_type:complete
MNQTTIATGMQISAVNKLLQATAKILNDDRSRPHHGAFKVGIDLGTADIQTIVLDAQNNPLACYMDWADVVRDGVVVDFQGACRIVKDQLRRASERLNITIEQATTSYPPGTDPRISINVVEAAGIDVNDVIDEPSSVARLLQLQQAAVVDIGGGTTGTAIIANGKVIKSVDDATGGRHITLTLAGHFGLSYEEAELLKRKGENAEILGLVTPVIAKMADLVKQHIVGHRPPAIYLTGGCCALPGFVEVFAAEFSGVDVILPVHPLHLTPLAIAAFFDRAEFSQARVR